VLLHLTAQRQQWNSAAGFFSTETYSCSGNELIKNTTAQLAFGAALWK